MKRKCAVCGGDDIRKNYTSWGAKYYFCIECDKQVKEIRNKNGEVKFVRVEENEQKDLCIEA